MTTCRKTGALQGLVAPGMQDAAAPGGGEEAHAPAALPAPTPLLTLAHTHGTKQQGKDSEV